MRIEHMPSPGTLSHAFDLRRAAMNAINQVEVVARGEPTDGATQLYNFFVECAKHLQPLVKKPATKKE